MKKFLKIIIILLFICFSVGCSENKKALTKKQITNKLSSMEFYVDDNTKLMEDSTIKTALSAYNGKYQIEYYIFKDKNRAEEAYSSNKKYFENNKKNGKEKKKDNYTKYTQELTDTYNVLTRVDNTLLYMSTNIEYKREVKNILKEINY